MNLIFEEVRKRTRSSKKGNNKEIHQLENCLKKVELVNLRTNYLLGTRSVKVKKKIDKLLRELIRKTWGKYQTHSIRNKKEVAQDRGKEKI